MYCLLPLAETLLRQTLHETSTCPVGPPWYQLMFQTSSEANQPIISLMHRDNEPRSGQYELMSQISSITYGLIICSSQ